MWGLEGSAWSFSDLEGSLQLALALSCSHKLWGRGRDVSTGSKLVTAGTEMAAVLVCSGVHNELQSETRVYFVQFWSWASEMESSAGLACWEASPLACRWLSCCCWSHGRPSVPCPWCVCTPKFPPVRTPVVWIRARQPHLTIISSQGPLSKYSHILRYGEGLDSSIGILGT